MLQGAEFQKYTFLSEVGSGAYSTVYKACKYNKKLAKFQLFAIKKVSNNIEGHPEVLKRQITFLNKLSHPNIIQLKGLFCDDHYSYLIMQFMEFDLITFYKKYRKENGAKLSDRLIKSIMHQVCSALKYLHKDCQLMHRDIKPENIMIDYRDGEIVAKLIDFGFMKRVGLMKKMTPYMVTRWYRPIQIALGLCYDEKADIFSLGAVLLQVYLGQQIFKSHSNFHQIDLICRICGYPNWNPAIQKLNYLGVQVNPFSQPEIYNLTQGLSKQAAQLIIGMLQPVPICRLTIEQVLSHRYFSTISHQKIENIFWKNRTNSHSKPLLRIHSLSKRDRNSKSTQSDIKIDRSPNLDKKIRKIYTKRQTQKNFKFQSRRHPQIFEYANQNLKKSQEDYQIFQPKKKVVFPHSEYYDLKGSQIKISIVNLFPHKKMQRKNSGSSDHQMGSRRLQRVKSDKNVSLKVNRRNSDQIEALEKLQKMKRSAQDRTSDPFHHYYQMTSSKGEPESTIRDPRRNRNLRSCKKIVQKEDLIRINELACIPSRIKSMNSLRYKSTNMSQSGMDSCGKQKRVKMKKKYKQ